MTAPKRPAPATVVGIQGERVFLPGATVEGGAAADPIPMRGVLPVREWLDEAFYFAHVFWSIEECTDD